MCPEKLISLLLTLIALLFLSLCVLLVLVVVVHANALLNDHYTVVECRSSPGKHARAGTSAAPSSGRVRGSSLSKSAATASSAVNCTSTTSSAGAASATANGTSSSASPPESSDSASAVNILASAPQSIQSHQPQRSHVRSASGGSSSSTVSSSSPSISSSLGAPSVPSAAHHQMQRSVGNGTGLSVSGGVAGAHSMPSSPAPPTHHAHASSSLTSIPGSPNMNSHGYSRDTVSVFRDFHDNSKLRFSITSTVPVHSATEKEFTAFLVTIINPAEEGDPEPRTILRRYRQFAALHAAVSKSYSDSELPHFPKKRLIGNMSQQLVEKRRKKLEIWLQAVAKLDGVDELLGFVTFLGGELPQRGVKKKTMTTGGNAGAAGALSSSNPSASNSGSPGSLSSSLSSSSPSHFANNRDSVALASSGEMMDDSYRETEKEKEQRVAAERRYNEVKYFVGRLDSCIYKLEAVEQAFEYVYETSDFVVHSEYSKLVVILGKYLGTRPLSQDFVPRELPKEKEDLIANPKIRSIRQKIIPAISELVSKLRDIKDLLLDVTFPMDQVLALTHIIDDVQDIFEESNLVPKSLGFRIESGATHYEAMREKWTDYIESNIYHYKCVFAGHDHIIAYNGERTEGSICVALKLERTTEEYAEFKLFVCSRDGNDLITTKVHFNGPAITGITGRNTVNSGAPSSASSTSATSNPNYFGDWKEKYADILTAADNRLRGIEWTTCSPADGEAFLLEHEKRDMRITRKLKFGILLCLRDQEKEEDMFGNFSSTPALENFLDGMGERVQLSGYQGFAGGLDTRGGNSTGTHSYVHNWPGVGDSGAFQIMYHVSTMLPHGEADQNLAKKRHIGNDIVAIVFQEDGSKPFQATTIKSNYLQIIIVVRSINLGEGKYAWRVTVSNAQDVPEYGPPLPYPPIFTDRTLLCQWLVHKMVNGELAAYRGKLFMQQFRTTWKTLVSELVTKLPQKKTSKATSSKPSKTPKKNK